MKKWFSYALFDFRWKKMDRWQKTMLIMSVGIMLLSAMMLCVGAWFPFGEDVGTKRTASIVLAFFVFVWAVPCIQEVSQVEGRINQKYLSEMNEIRISLGRKPWGDI